MGKVTKMGTGKPDVPQAKGEERGEESDTQFFRRGPKKEARSAEEFLAEARERWITRTQLAGMREKENAEGSREKANGGSLAATETWEILAREAFGNTDTDTKSHSPDRAMEGGMAETLKSGDIGGENSANKSDSAGDGTAPSENRSMDAEMVGQDSVEASDSLG
jgi:hypothetical protein